LGCLSSQEAHQKEDREISFSSTLRDMIGHHLHGSRWAHAIKEALHEHNLNGRPLHIISANLHSVMNSLYAEAALPKEAAKYPFKELFQLLSLPENGKLRQRVTDYARQHGMVQLDDTSGTNISVQFFDLEKIKNSCQKSRNKYRW
jgi:hypothetical protein